MGTRESVLKQVHIVIFIVNTSTADAAYAAAYAAAAYAANAAAYAANAAANAAAYAAYDDAANNAVRAVKAYYNLNESKTLIKEYTEKTIDAKDFYAIHTEHGTECSKCVNETEQKGQ